MIPYWANKKVYELIDQFLEKSVLGNDSFLTKGDNILTLENLNKCITTFVDNQDKGNRSFDEKANDQFKDAGYEEKLVFAHGIWLWSFAVSDMTKGGKRSAVTRFFDEDFNNLLNDVFVKGGIGSAGQWHKQNKPFEISYALLLLRYIKQNIVPKINNDLNKLKEGLTSLCLNLYYKKYEGLVDSGDRLFEISGNQIALHHILLHLCLPEKFEPISSNNHKERIVSAFYSVLDMDSPDPLCEDIDGSIFKIRNELSSLLENPDLTFYDKEIAGGWDYHDSEWGIDMVKMFEFKKAIIFYGPPGTSKTHSADQIAELLITKHYFRNKKGIKDFITNKNSIISKHKHTLQLHSNYGYEEFIAGIHLENHNTIAKKGWLLNLIEKVQNDESPHIVILDEINRVDLSRLFGELFSRIEYRDAPVQVAVGGFEISIPDNLYFIGTMNEIDFSLERVDFALRRRFLWEFMGYNESILKEILKKKMEERKINLKEELIGDYIGRCSILNSKITDEPELGAKFQIGHTFFGELIDITSTYKGINNRKRFNTLNEPSKILWNISLRPMLEAYFGNMDEQTRLDKLKVFEKIFLNG